MELSGAPMMSEPTAPKPSSAKKRKGTGVDLDQIMDSMNADERQTSIGYHSRVLLFT